MPGENQKSPQDFQHLSSETANVMTHKETTAPYYRFRDIVLLAPPLLGEIEVSFSFVILPSYQMSDQWKLILVLFACRCVSSVLRDNPSCPLQMLQKHYQFLMSWEAFILTRSSFRFSVWRHFQRFSVRVLQAQYMKWINLQVVITIFS